MEKKVKVSIVVPSLNSAEYMRECLDSIVTQSLQDIEVLCIDSASNDGTCDIINEYASKDSRIIPVFDAKKSCGYAYNHGIDIATGEYIGFVETDDYISKDMFRRLYEVANEKNVDYVKGNHTIFLSVDNKHYLYKKQRFFDKMTLENIYGKVINPKLYKELPWKDHYMWNGIYNRDFLIRNSISAHETPGGSYQDFGFLQKVFCHATKAIYLDEEFYFYRVDNSNASMKRADGLERLLKEYLLVKKDIENNPEIGREDWWIFYKKLIGMLEFWCTRWFLSNENASEELMATIDGYVKLLKDGWSNGYIDPVDMGFDKYNQIRILLESKEKYTEFIRNKVQTVKLYHDTFMENIKKAASIVIMGAGDCGQRLYKILRENNINTVICFCDNDREKIGNELFGVPICSLKDIGSEYDNATFVIANVSAYMDLWRQLKSNKIKEDHIKFYQITELEYQA